MSNHLSIFDGESIQIVSLPEPTHNNWLDDVYAAMDSEAEKAEKNGVEVHIVAFINGYYHEEDRGGVLVPCKNQTSPH